MARGKIVITDEQKSFLLSPAARELKPDEAKKLSKDDAYERFKDVRWGWQSGKPYCPWCGHKHVYERATRATFKCASCGRDFTVTTRTAFRGRKMPYSVILHAISLRLHDPKNALQACDDLGVTYKTSWHLARKFRTLVGPMPARQRRGPVRQGAGNVRDRLVDARWPFAAQEKRNDCDLVARVNSVVAKNLPEQVRADVAQDIILGVLEGNISEDDLAEEARRYIKAHYTNMEWRFDTVSLDQPMRGTDSKSWYDVIAMREFAL